MAYKNNSLSGNNNNRRYNDDGLSASERHRLYRAQIDAERAERRRQEALADEARRRRAFENGKGSRIMATWKLHGGAKTKAWGEVRGGMFYTGSNPLNLVEPSVPEPSLLSPRFPVADSSEGMEPIRHYPTYADMTKKQRKAYIEFLASDRTHVDDIGLVFLYLCGFERRLIIDARKSGEVSVEERVELTRELLRLLRVFGDKSASLRQYIGMLLLYDGTVFDVLSVDRVLALFECNVVENNPMGLYSNTDNAYAMAYFLVARFIEHGIDVPLELIIEVACHRVLISSASIMRSLKYEDVHNDAVLGLAMERAMHVDLSRVEPAASDFGDYSPLYFPSSVSIRQKRNLRVASHVGINLDKVIHLTAYCNIVLTCYYDVVTCRGALERKRYKDLAKYPLDALSYCVPERCALDTFLGGKQDTVAVPARVLVDDLRRRFGYDMEANARGVLNSSSQFLIGLAAGMSGWQAVLPETIEGLVPSFWRVSSGSDCSVVMFKRGVARSKRNGRRCIGKVFGGDENSTVLVLPGDWLVPSCLAYVYAYFIHENDELDFSDARSYSARYFPVFAGGSKKSLRKNQIRLFFSLISMTIISELSARGIKIALENVDFSDVQDLVFSLCDERFGNVLPTGVLESIESLYVKSGHDKAMVLYDYHAGTYHVEHDSDVDGFFINEERLAETIDATSNVHSILNEAMSSTDEYDDADDTCADNALVDNAGINISASSANHNDNADEMSVSRRELSVHMVGEQLPSNGAVGADSVSADVSVMRERIVEAFGGNDEMATDDLLSALLGGDVVTTAQAMAVITSVNDVFPDFVEIDGADAYLNE